MKLSTNFLKDYVDVEINTKEDIYNLAENMTKVGNEYDFQGKLVNATNLTIGEVIECENHPDSDHLHVCKVNVGKEVLQIVCGGTKCKKRSKSYCCIKWSSSSRNRNKKSTIRGVESNGMLCSLLELGIEGKFLSEEEKSRNS